MICLYCRNVEVKKHLRLGYLPCEDCRKKMANFPRPQRQVEFTSESIKSQRKIFKDDIIQSHYKGQLDKRYVDLYGEERALKRGFTKQEIKKAKYLNIDEYYKR